MFAAMSITMIGRRCRIARERIGAQAVRDQLLQLAHHA
jgi:hypothetical protein